ncbi:hypothetical protein M5X06_12865 [Paenibacillus alvei]|uniref:Phosphoadenosine phosphosulphate reductase domain-containing protein n=1 Tax=Paenibacillus alvei TaxID=44250 RepID=A0ABT4GUP8_PAEAL|nr:hypothetical protein [Paenibacillus alvei]MCY9760412.1 hypothetical protein [Paenibacillus alvei]MCY9767704.1 hypothetical protein [Paenibacillus alvei]
MTKHINFNSGGIGSWSALQRIIAQYGTRDVINLFTDTLIEDRDLYRFLIETTAQAYGLPRPDELLSRCEEIPDIHSESDVDLRKQLIPEIASEAMRLIPGLVWVIDGRTPWDVFFNVRYLGNSRLAQCSHKLKQEVAAKWVKSTFPLVEVGSDGIREYKAPDVVLYLGIDWTEDHRTAAPVANWSPYPVRFPMCDEPYVDKTEMLAQLDSVGIARPRLYELGFAHNNCGGFCVRAGQGHYVNLLERFPEQFAYHEQREREIQKHLGKDVTILKQTRNKKVERLSLSRLREIYEDGKRRAEIDRDDIGGCGCFVTTA